MGIKEAAKAHKDEFLAKKKILKETKTDYKNLFIGIGQMVAGFFFFISYASSVWWGILFKIIAVVLFFNGVGFVLKSRKWDEKVNAHVVSHKEKVWGKDR